MGGKLHGGVVNVVAIFVTTFVLRHILKWGLGRGVGFLTFVNCCLCLTNVNDAWKNLNWCIVVDTKKIGKEPYLMREKDKEETSSSDAAIVPNHMKEGHRTISVFV